MIMALPHPSDCISYKGTHLSGEVQHFDSIDSTSTYLKAYAQQCLATGAKLSEGLAVLADQQTAGRGRLQRSWYSPPSGGFYFSLLLKPTIDVSRLTLLTLMAAVATAETIQAFCSQPLDIKWPNDILIARRKVSGILTEASFIGSSLDYVVVGIGVNLNQLNFPAELSQQATSLYLVTGTLVAQRQFLLALINQLDCWYGLLQATPSAILDRWQQLSSYAYNRSILVNIDNKLIKGVTSGLNAQGALTIKTSDHQLLTLYGSEITATEEI